MYKPYAGIGSRKTPDNILQIMKESAYSLYHHGYTLRTGGAEGADKAFIHGHRNACYTYLDNITTTNLEIYLPWDGFNGYNKSHTPLSDDAYKLAEEYHPAWSRLNDAARKLMARNSYQVLGHDLKTPSRFIICYTPNGNGSGGTGQAIRIAEDHDIPVFDLGKISRTELIESVRKRMEECQPISF